MVLSVAAIKLRSIQEGKSEKIEASQTEPKSQMMFHAPSFTM